MSYILFFILFHNETFAPHSRRIEWGVDCVSTIPNIISSIQSQWRNKRCDTSSIHWDPRPIQKTNWTNCKKLLSSIQRGYLTPFLSPFGFHGGKYVFMLKPFFPIRTNIIFLSVRIWLSPFDHIWSDFFNHEISCNYYGLLPKPLYLYRGNVRPSFPLP